MKKIKNVSYDKIFKLVLSEFFSEFFRVELFEVERGILLKEYRMDVFVIKALPKVVFPIGSWARFIVDNLGEYLIIESKSAGSRVSIDHMLQVLTYKLALSRENKCPLIDITVVLIVSKVPKRFVERLKKFISPELNLCGSNGLYKISGVRALEILIIAIDELDLEVEYNEILALFSSSENKSKEAAKYIFMKYKPDTFIYAFTLIYKPEVSYMARTELVSPEKLRLAVSVIGPEKLAKALGPEELAEIVEAIGPEKLAKALDPNKLFELVCALLKNLPSDKLKELQSVLSSNKPRK